MKRSISVFLISFLGLAFLSFSVIAADYYYLTDAGYTYPWFNHKKDRDEYLIKHLPSLSNELQEKIRSFTEDGFAPHNGDIGRLLTDLRPGQDFLILDVMGAHFLVRPNAVRPATSAEQNEFVKRVSNYGGNIMGFQLGRTTPAEAVRILKQRNARFDPSLAYKGNSEMPIISVTDFRDAPNINGRLPNRLTLGFINNRLYQITLAWWPKSNSSDDIAEYKRFLIYQNLMAALSEKYQREPLESSRDMSTGEIIWTYWLSPLRSATLKSFNFAEGGQVLTYSDNELSKMADQQKAIFDQRSEQDKVTKLRNSL